MNKVNKYAVGLFLMLLSVSCFASKAHNKFIFTNTCKTYPMTISVDKWGKTLAPGQSYTLHEHKTFKAEGLPHRNTLNIAVGYLLNGYSHYVVFNVRDGVNNRYIQGVKHPIYVTYGETKSVCKRSAFSYCPTGNWNDTYAVNLNCSGL